MIYPTKPSARRGEIVCNDDCDNCPLFQRGCARRCVRWDNLVCNDCPCLGSKYADKHSDPVTVDPQTLAPEETEAVLLRIRELRRNKRDGEAV